ncbi:MAG TPA: hypothetical protein VFT74_10210 [Isosphaeraceae bacterium]|nr:hypothetical protein [Isosphaeraceae bacterium]
MLRRTWPLALALAALVGCENAETPTDTAAPETAPATTDAATPAPAPAPEASADDAAAPTVTTVALTEDEIAEIKKLPEAEAEVALKQKVCPISDENLGAMGTPIKVEADGKTAFLCCEGCKEEFEKDPKAALAKLGLDK